MYTQTWAKYLSIIRILIKRSVDSEQSLKLNAPDFTRIPGPKASKFSIHFKNGKAVNTIGMHPLGKDLAAVLLQDPLIADLFMQNEYEVFVNSKFEMGIRMIQPAAELTGIALVGDAQIG
ncbi:MAG TPA: hypothetical protein VFR58_16345 [Flavisolibacter sp.]|nr:hypothetical protein [Flavisolibacter sp.]